MTLNQIIGRYAVLLAAALLIFVLEPAMARSPETPWDLSAVSLLLLLGSVRAVWENHRFFRVVALLGGLFWISEAAETVLGGALPVVTDACALAFIGATICGILYDVFSRRTVSADAVFGAAAVYLLIGLWFARAYMIIAHYEPEAFSASDALMRYVTEEGYRATGALHYFSLITLTTVGYGDITPVDPIARNLAAVEAVIAQLFIAAVVARLVAVHTANLPTLNDKD